MFTNYLKASWRYIVRHPGYSLVNIFGLAAGLASCLMIMLWVQDELGYDGFHLAGDRICRVVVHIREPGGGTESFTASPPNLGPALAEQFPQVSLYARHLYGSRQIVSHGDRKFYESDIALVDPQFLKIFSFAAVSGDPVAALAEPRSVVITAAVARKYFGAGNPLGRQLLINNSSPFRVGAVLKDPPKQSHLSFGILLPFLAAGEFAFPTDTWERFSYDTYLLVNPGTDLAVLGRGISSLLRKQLSDADLSVDLQPLSAIHLYSAGIQEGFSRGNIKTVLLFSLLAFLILLMACVNYLNLTTALGSSRGKEVGLRKVNGAGRGEIAGQFLVETVIQTMAAMLAALLLMALLMPLFNSLSGKQLTIWSLLSFRALLPLALFFLGAVLLAGLYPALYLSRFQAAGILKGKSVVGAGGSGFRKVLVIFQFSLMIAMVVASMTIYRQLQFLRGQNPGFNKENVVMVPLRGELSGRLASLKSELQRISSVEAVSAASNPVMMFESAITLESWENSRPGDDLTFSFVWCDGEYLRANGITLKQGRFFSPGEAERQRNGVVINERAARALGFGDPLGKRLGEWTIIGVVSDFNSRTMHSAISPVAMLNQPEKFRYLFVRVRPGNPGAVLAELEQAWNRVAPEYPFDYSFLDDNIARLYSADQKLGKIVNAFTFLALLIANLGLFSLASYLTAKRRKEIGVRKVLGASLWQIMTILSAQFLKWVALAALIAIPCAFLAVRSWLHTFAYRITPGIGLFLLAAASALLVALLTISLQVVRAARANPVESLRYE